ncbi:MAG TPA: glycosyltransferase [Candidatus Binataceae bacterium]|nr:glycosyltransferase [Candidatus Binataceae bacterium]
MKVLFVTNWYPSASEPTKALWVREHAKAVSSYDDVVVLHFFGLYRDLETSWKIERESDEAISDGIPTYRIRCRPPLVGRVLYPVYVCRVIQAIRRLSQEGFKPDVIHVHVYEPGVPAVVFGRLNRIPVVVSEHLSSFPMRTLGRLDLWKARFAMRRAEMVLPVSAFLQQALERYGIRARYQLMPNAVDTGLFRPPSDRIRRNALKQMLFVGQLAPVKDLGGLFKALCQLRRKRDDWRLDIVGEGQGRVEYERQAAELKISDVVTFRGMRSRQEVAEFMREADLFVLPSRVETFSVPAAEALAAGLPVVATSCGGPQEFITQETGLLVPPGDTEALSKGLDYMLDNLHLYPGSRISQYAVERFARQSVGAKLHAVYRCVTECNQN